jgi:sigma-B regulation protein RsbU (phosphoserine phosphatase)
MQIKIFKPQAVLEELPELLALVEGEGVRAGIPEAAIFKIQVILEEIYVNVVNYAYNGQRGPLEIRLRLRQNTLRLIVADRGVPFNPLQQKEPDLRERFDQGIPGGAGLVLVRGMASALAYRRLWGRNVLKVGLRV